MKTNSILLLLIVVNCFFSCDKNYHDDLMKNVLGIDNLDFKILCSYEDLSIQGEGLSVFVYSLKENDVKNILGEGIYNYPSKTTYRKTWYVSKWKSMPIDDLDKGLYRHSIASYEFNENGCLINHDLNNLIMDTNNYYATFYYDDNKQEPLSVELFILNIKESKMYYISNKT